MPTESLISLISDQIDLIQRVIENEGEVADDLEAAIRENHVSLSGKIDSYAFILDELDFRAEFLRERAQRISAAARTLESKAEHLRDRLRLSMSLTGTTLKGNEIEFGLGKPSVSINLKEGISIEGLPSEFVRVKKELDKASVSEKWGSLEPSVQEKFNRIEKPRLLQRIRTTSKPVKKEINRDSN